MQARAHITALPEGRMTGRSRETLEEQLDGARRKGLVAAWRWLGSRHDAEDAVNDATARALGAKTAYDPSRPFYPWFYRILRNLCFDRLSAGRRAEQPETSSESTAHALAQASGSEPDPLASLLQGEREHAMQRAVRQLAPEMREVIELRHFQDLSYEEIAQSLDVPTGTVMSRLYRARRALREKLLSDAESPWRPSEPTGESDD